MSTDFRALCRELTDVLAELPFGTCEELVVRARAALAEPVPEDDVALLREALAATAAQRRAEDDARAALAEPAPPASGEVGELVEWLRAWALGTMEEGQPATSRSLTRAADLLALAYATGPDSWEPIPLLPTQRHPEPVPVSERPWEREGWCDGQDRCWFCNSYSMGQWSYSLPPSPGQGWGRLGTMTHSLPHWAIPRPRPLPQQETTNG